MAPSATFRCIAGCSGSYPLEQVIYRCPTCGGLLEVVHDLEALRERPAEAWKALFAERWRSVEEPWGSGVWGKHEWVAPGLRAEHIVSMLEGVTHLTPRAPLRAGARSWRRSRQAVRDFALGLVQGPRHDRAGLDGQADDRRWRRRSARSRARRPATPRPRSRRTRRPRGSAAVVILPRGKISTAQLVQPLAMGALVLAIDTDFDGCMRLVQELADQRGRLPRELDELAAARGPEDRRDRARAAARLAGAGLGRDPGRQPRQRVGARRRVRDVARARAGRSRTADLCRAGRAREPARRELPRGLGRRSSRSRPRPRSRRRSRSATR